MKKLFLSKPAKIVVDILLVLAFVVLFIVSDAEESMELQWESLHCGFGRTWLLIMMIHIAQHWRLIKSFIRKKTIMRNKITALTILSFILVTVGVIALGVDFGAPFLMFHEITGSLFMLMMLIHTIDKFKLFASLFKKE